MCYSRWLVVTPKRSRRRTCRRTPPLAPACWACVTRRQPASWRPRLLRPASGCTLQCRCGAPAFGHGRSAWQAAAEARLCAASAHTSCSVLPCVQWLSRGLPLLDTPAPALVTASTACGSSSAAGAEVLAVAPAWGSPILLPQPYQAAVAQVAAGAPGPSFSVFLSTPLGPARAEISSQQLAEAYRDGRRPVTVEAQPLLPDSHAAVAAGAGHLRVLLQASVERGKVEGGDDPPAAVSWRVVATARRGRPACGKLAAANQSWPPLKASPALLPCRTAPASQAPVPARCSCWLWAAWWPPCWPPGCSCWLAVAVSGRFAGPTGAKRMKAMFACNNSLQRSHAQHRPWYCRPRHRTSPPAAVGCLPSLQRGGAARGAPAAGRAAAAARRRDSGSRPGGRLAAEAAAGDAGGGREGAPAAAGGGRGGRGRASSRRAGFGRPAA